LALGAALQALQGIGMQAIAQHESELTAYALQRMAQVQGLRIYGDTDSQRAAQRLGVIPFNLQPHPHALVAAVLSAEYGIGVRSGCFCAHPYLTHLLGLTKADAQRVRAEMAAADRSHVPGMVRISFGMYNTFDEVDLLIDSLSKIARGEFRGKYDQDRGSGEYSARGWAPELGDYSSRRKWSANGLRLLNGTAP
jgi:selenocysteine lyase/cysteine desulfurase